MNQMEQELSTEERLRSEIADLRRQLEQQQQRPPQQAAPAPPSRLTLGALSLVGVIAVVVAFFAGYVPHQKREQMLIAEAKAEAETRPTVTVAVVRRAPAKVDLVLPGSIQAVMEAPVLARADGYIKKRYADIGDRVKAGQLLAELEAPELDQQVQQARASLEQTRSELDVTGANLEQGKTNEELARVTAAAGTIWLRRAQSPGRRTISTRRSLRPRRPASSRCRKPWPPPEATCRLPRPTSRD